MSEENKGLIQRFVEEKQVTITGISGGKIEEGRNKLGTVPGQ